MDGVDYVTLPRQDFEIEAFADDLMRALDPDVIHGSMTVAEIIELLSDNSH